MTNPNLTEIVCIFDRSGSMGSLHADAIEGMNAFIAQQQKLPGEARLSAARISIEATATVSFVASPAGVRQAYADMGARVTEARRRPRKGA